MLKLFKNFTKKDWVFAIIAFVFIIGQVWLDLKIPDYMSKITMLIQSHDSTMSEIYSSGWKMLFCALASLLSAVIVAILAARIASNFGANTREKLFDKVQYFSLEEINKFSTASLITRSTNDISQVQMFVVMGLQVIIRAPIMATWAIYKIYEKNWQWTLSTGIAVLAMLLLVGTCIFLVMPKFKRLQILTDNLNRVTRENLTGLSVVRAYNAEQYQEAKFEITNHELTATNLFANRVMSVMMPGIQSIMSGLSLAIYWIGAILIENATIPDKMTLFSEMVVFSSYAMQVVIAFMMLIIIFFMLPRASVSAKRILAVLKTESTITNGQINEGEIDQRGKVEFKNVSFKYPDAKENVLNNISFTANQGETVAFLGATGCGKTTVINLIPRFYDASKGEVLVNGINVKEYDQASLHNKIGYVSQKAILFSGTVESNIAYGDNDGATPLTEHVEKAAKIAKASQFIEKMDEDYQSYVAQGGTNFSGGQKQRLSIARAICRQPEIFIFDDSFSALDYKTDLELREELKRECQSATKLIVAQRIGTIRDADKIIVLENGKIAGMGKHDELMKDCPVYIEIANSQLSKEELG